MLNATYTVLHTDTGNLDRNRCAAQVHSIMTKTFPTLVSPTVYLSTFKEVDKFCEENPAFRVNQIKAQTPEGRDFPTNSGIVGVFASNYLAYKKFLETDKDILFIFEDDATVSVNFAEVVDLYSTELPEGWDFWAIYVPDDCLPWYNSDYDIGERKYICRTYQDWSCAGYAVSRKGAELAVKDIETHGMANPIDWYIFNSRHLGTGTIYFSTMGILPSVYRPVSLSLETSQLSTIHEQSTEHY
jgi:GR25 family glycosyltransferase involved in LPS biosynthesis